jgi:dCMP deaminase
MEVAKIFAERSTCLRKQVGCVVVRDRRIIVTAYNGAPPNMPHCGQDGALPCADTGCENTTHAEANAIAWAARQGSSLEGCDVYTTLSPCLACAKLFIAAGVKRVWYCDEYRNADGLELLHRAGVDLGRV